MESWWAVCLLLTSFGFFKELRPSEAFLTTYLLGPPQNLTENEVYFQIYPVWTYSYLSLLIAVFLITDVLRYKPVIVFEGLGYVATWSLLLWARGVGWMQFMEFCYGIATSTEVAYYTYIYAKVDQIHFQKVTSFTRTAILSGRFMAGVLSQILYSTHLMNPYTLNYFSLTSVSIACVIAFVLPPVKHSVYFHRDQVDYTAPSGDEVQDKPIQHEEEAILRRLKKVFCYIWSDFMDAYRDKYLLKWSIWWACATCMNFQVGNYIQPLWITVQPEKGEEVQVYYGAVEAISTLLSALAAFSVAYMRVNWVVFGEFVLGLISLINGFVLVFMGFSKKIWVAYIGYIFFRASYQMLITIASYQVAGVLKERSYALIFGFNMFIALLLQALLTAVVINWLYLGPEIQFVVYGCYFEVLAFVFMILAVVKFIYLGCDKIRLAESKGQTDPVAVALDEPPPGSTTAI